MNIIYSLLYSSGIYSLETGWSLIYLEQTLKLMMPCTHHESVKGLLLFKPEMVKQDDLSRRTEKVSPDQWQRWGKEYGIDKSCESQRDSSGPLLWCLRLTPYPQPQWKHPTFTRNHAWYSLGHASLFQLCLLSGVSLFFRWKDTLYVPYYKIPEWMAFLCFLSIYVSDVSLLA